MPEYRRAHLEGGTYFFTVNTLDRQHLLLKDDVRTALRGAIAEVRRSHPFRIDAWVLLPDHLHCIWTLPPGDHNFSARWQAIKRIVTQQCGTSLLYQEKLTTRRIQRKQGTIWQHRFWEHLIRDEADYSRHFDYIHWNPVKHGYVHRALDWQFSTFHRYVAEGIYSPEWGVSEAWKDGEKFGEANT